MQIHEIFGVPSEESFDSFQGYDGTSKVDPVVNKSSSSSLVTSGLYSSNAGSALLDNVYLPFSEIAVTPPPVNESVQTVLPDILYSSWNGSVDHSEAPAAPSGTSDLSYFPQVVAKEGTANP
ncbi:hypothetical protein BG005_010095, partial [Podila minutissima]